MKRTENREIRVTSLLLHLIWLDYQIQCNNQDVTPIPPSVKTTENKFSDNPGQVKRLDEMEKTLKECQTAVTEPMIALRRKIGDSQIREQIAIFIQRESTLMEKRNKNYDTAQVLNLSGST